MLQRNMPARRKPLIADASVPLSRRAVDVVHEVRRAVDRSFGGANGGIWLGNLDSNQNQAGKSRSF